MIGRPQWMGAAVVLGGLAGGGQARAEGAFAGLAAALARIEASRGGRLGVAVLDTASGEAAGHRQDERFPLGSTYKLLAAGAVLARADAGRDSMARPIRFTRDDLVTYSPVTEAQAGGEGMTLEALCEATLVTSDNTAGNLLLDALGGPAGLTAWLRGLGDTVTRLDRKETALNEARPGDPRDTTSPAAMLADLRALTLGPALSAASRNTLQRWLRGNKTGDARLRARLPPGWQAGEKTGTSAHGTSNDVGLLWPPGGAAPVLVSAYLTEGAADGALRDAALADVGAAVAEAWMRRGSR
jgi:beta-lactamase class A